MRKEIIQVWRDPRTLAIILLQPVMMLFLYGYGVTSDITNVNLGVVDWSQTSESRDLIQRFTASGYFRHVYASHRYADLGHALDARFITAGVVIPPDFVARLTRGDTTPVQVLLEGTNPSSSLTASSYLQSIAGTYSSDRMLALAQRRGTGTQPRGVPPLDLRVRVWYNEDLKSVVFIVPGLIVVILMTTSALLTSGAIAREKERGTFEQMVASPIKPYELMVGKLLTYTALSYLDVALVVLIGTLWFGVPLRGSLLLLIGCSGLFLMGSLGIGLLISSVTPSQRTAMLLVQMLTSMPSIMLSGFYFPISSMPAPVQMVTTLIPARYFMVIVRGIFLKDAGIAELWTQIVPLAFFGMIPLALSILTFKKRL
jgi:ABC-2 type transport system permease protein